MAVIHSGPLGRSLVSMRWGFVPTWYKSPSDGPVLINARSETIATKPAFAQACQSRRCLIPIAGFYEWAKGAGGQRLPWYIRRTDAQPMALAGVWQTWGAEQMATCAIVTTSANAQMSTLHSRMPLMVEQANWGLWLGEAGAGAARLMTPAPEGALTAHRVHPRINSNQSEGAELIEPFYDELDAGGEQSGAAIPQPATPKRKGAKKGQAKDSRQGSLF